MIEARRPDNEAARLAALRSYDILDTEPEEAFDDLTQIASQICGTPIAVVSLVDEERQWFKSHLGLDATETPRRVAFCSHAILDPGNIMVVPDAFEDERFADNPIVTGAPHVRFYAGTPLVTSDNYAVGTLCVIDHTPRQLSEEQLRALRGLGRQVAAQLELRRRCIELREHAASLQSLNDEIGRRNKEIGSFYHTLAHELKTPLTAAREFIALTLDEIPGAINPDQRELLATAKSCCDQIRTHVNDLLDVTRLETGKLSLTPVSVRVDGAIAKAVAATSQPARERRIDVCSQLPADLPLIQADETRLVQVFSNLLGNAIKFTPEGGFITIEARCDDEEGMVTVEVSDTGLGIPADQLERVFDRLYQVREDDASIKGGLGLGLSLCREIVRLHGGAIAVKSTVGVGSSFSVRLPFVLSGSARVTTAVCGMSETGS